MSWLNPSPDEASENYSYYEHKYNDAAAQKNAAAKQEKACRSEKSALQGQMAQASSDKVNFEKRLSGLEKIIKMLEGTDIFVDVPRDIQKLSKAVKKTDESFRESIRVQGITTSSIESAFAVKTVEGDPNSAQALEEYRAEKVRLEQSIAELKQQISGFHERISQLNAEIRSCTATQVSMKHIMNSSAYEMNHYRKFMD